MALDQATIEAALQNCDNDPIHIPGSIQGFGYLIATDAEFKKFNYISKNFDEIAPNGIQKLLSAPPGELFTEKEQHKIKNVLGHSTIENQREQLFTKVLAGKTLHVTAHIQANQAIFELVETHANDSSVDPLEEVRGVLSMLNQSNSMEDMFQQVVNRLRWLSGFDRVKAYRFLPDDSGEVFAESKHAEVPSYLNLRFPAYDIPPSARRLYASTPSRFLWDILADNIPVIAADPAYSPLDMSLSVLRGLNPVHAQYLKNMGVRSTLTLPIVVDGRLWGLFALHHYRLLQPSPTLLLALELIGRLVSLHTQHLLEQQRHKLSIRLTKLAQKFAVLGDSELSLATYWQNVNNELQQSLLSDGVIFCLGKELFRHGESPGDAACQLLTALIDLEKPDPLSIDNLRQRFPGMEWGNTAGALILPLSSSPRSFLIFTRKLSELSVNWAGAPEKEIVMDQEGPKLNPRNSFNLYKESVSDRCDEWTTHDIEVATILRDTLARSIELQQDASESRHRLGLMVRELNHRIRSILALVHSLAEKTKQNATSVEQYAQALEDRIIALANAHNLLTKNNVKSVRFSSLLKQELKPYVTGGKTPALEGDKTELQSEAATVVALVLHELTTNAAKYGALSHPQGHLKVHWQRSDAGLMVHWLETGMENLSPPQREGFGRSIIERSIPFELKGEAKLSFKTTGVQAQFMIPNHYLAQPCEEATANANSTINPVTPAANPAPSAMPVLRQRSRALVVEDSFPVAEQGVQLLKAAHFDQVEAVSTVKEALERITKENYDFCILDIDLKGELSEPVAAALISKEIPFIFVTGYGSEGKVITGFDHVTTIEKPLRGAQLTKLLKRLSED